MSAQNETPLLLWNGGSIILFRLQETSIAPITIIFYTITFFAQTQSKMSLLTTYSTSHFHSSMMQIKERLARHVTS